MVHYGKLNKLTKRHSGTFSIFERALGRASACWYKSNLDKRRGFRHVQLTKGAADLSAFVAQKGQFLKWKSMPFGLARAPATFQELMNQVLQRMKRKATVQGGSATAQHNLHTEHYSKLPVYFTSVLRIPLLVHLSPDFVLPISLHWGHKQENSLHQWIRHPQIMGV